MEMKALETSSLCLIMLVVAMAVAVDLLADLAWGLVGHLGASLAWDGAAGLSWHLKGDLPGHLMTLLPWNINAFRVWNFSDNVLAVGFWHSLATWGLDEALGLVGNLLAHAVNLGLALGSVGWSDNCCCGVVAGFSIGFGFALVEATRGNGAVDWVDGGMDAMGSDWSGVDGVGSDWSGVDSVGSDLALNSDQLGLFANLGLNVFALFSDGGVNDSVGLVDANLPLGGGTLLLGHLAAGGTALPLRDGVADGVMFGPVLGLGHGLADVLVGGVALGAVGGLVDGLANRVGPGLMAVSLGIATMPSVATISSSVSPVTSVVASACFSLGLWLGDGNGSNKAQDQKGLHGV